SSTGWKPHPLEVRIGPHDLRARTHDDLVVALNKPWTLTFTSTCASALGAHAERTTASLQVLATRPLPSPLPSPPPTTSRRRCPCGRGPSLRRCARCTDTCPVCRIGRGRRRGRH